MVEVENRTPLPHLCFEKAAPDGSPWDVVVLRGTFAFAADGRPVREVDEQPPLLYGDEYDGPLQDQPQRAVLRRDGDLVLVKERTDVHLIGTARVQGKAQRTWVASLGVGPVRKSVALHGPRWFERSWGRWRLGETEAVDALPLDYRLAFGGCFVAPAAQDRNEVSVCKPDNPAGRGWLPDAAVLKTLGKAARADIEDQIAGLERLPAAQIEDPDSPVTQPTQSWPAQGFGPIARWWQPRARLAGTFDDAWRCQTYPRLPADFDRRFFNSAHPDLIAPGFLNGDEPMAMLGLDAQGPLRMALPGWVIAAAPTLASGKKSIGRLVLDTVAIDLDARSVSLVWRGSFPRDDALRRLALAALREPRPGQLEVIGATTHEALHV